jgi:hypothetical protein
MRSSLFGAGLIALALSACTTTGDGVSFGSAPQKPKAVVVTDFVFASEVVAVDRGYTARLSRKAGVIPTHERKQITAARVNDEIVAAIVATLREAGLEAQPGNEDALAISDTVMVVSGRLRVADESKPPKKDAIGFGPGRGAVAADMTLLQVSSGSRKRLSNFVAQPAARGTAPPRTFGAGVTSALAQVDARAEKLSPDVEGEARRLGRSIGEQVVAYARMQGWVSTEVPVAAATPKPKKPAPKPAADEAEKKPAA